MTQLYGTLPSQVPTNADLGTMAFQDANAINVANATVTGTLATSSDATIHGITVGLGGGANINNSAFGLSALLSNTSGFYTTAIGRTAGYSQTAGAYNTYIGHGAGYTATPANANISGSFNTWLGMNSGPGTTAQLANSTAIGYGALNLNSNEMVLGNSSLTSVTTAAAITAAGGFIGHASLDLPLTGGVVTGGLTTNGYSALGYGVTQVAPSATAINTTAAVNLGGFGSNGLFVGQYPTSNMVWMQSSFTNPTTAKYHISLQPLGGNVGIGTGSTAPVSLLQVNGLITAGSLTSTGTITSSGYLYTGYNSGGSAYPASSFGGAIGGNWSNADAEVNYWNANTGAANLSFTWRQLTGASASTQLMQLSPSGTLTVTTLTQTSDETKKENWVTPDSRSTVEFLAARSKYGNFNWKEVTGSSLGCSAQEFKSSPVFENAIHESDEGLAMNYGGAAIVACIALAKELELLRAELAELRGVNSASSSNF